MIAKYIMYDIFFLSKNKLVKILCNQMSFLMIDYILWDVEEY